MNYTLLVQADFEKAIEYINNISGQGFIFELDYVDIAINFREIDRFLWESKKNMRYKNKYKGSVIINLSKWNGKPINKYFHAFIYMIRDNYTECSFITESPADNELIDELSKHYNNLKVKSFLEKEQRIKPIGFAIEEEANNVRE